MGQLVATQNNQPPAEVIDLFGERLGELASEHRTKEQRERLLKRALEVAEMLDRLDGQLRVDREQAVSMLAEYSGLLELVVEDIRQIRDMDEGFGGSAGGQPKLAGLALQLERGISYLLGIFSVIGSGEVLPVYNWKLVHRDVQEVLGVSQSLTQLLTPPAVKSAA